MYCVCMLHCPRCSEQYEQMTDGVMVQRGYLHVTISYWKLIILLSVHVVCVLSVYYSSYIATDDNW